MLKRISLAIMLSVCTIATAQAGIISGTLDRLTFAQEFGVGVPVNDDLFQSDWKPSLYAAPRMELYIGKGVSIYTKYAFNKFDVVAGADSNAAPIDASGWVYGAMVAGNLSASGSVLGCLELGVQKSVSPTEPDEWQFWQGLFARCYCTSDKSTFIDLGLRYKPLGDTPVVEELLPRVAFGVGL